MTTHIDIELNRKELFATLIEWQQDIDPGRLILTAFREDPALYNPPMVLFTAGEQSTFIVDGYIRADRESEYIRVLMYRTLSGVIEAIKTQNGASIIVAVSSNEMRGFIGLPPVKDPEADKLSNKNLPEQDKPGNEPKAVEGSKPPEEAEDIGELKHVK